MKTGSRNQPRERGFTLVEIMVVVVILGLLATIVAQNVLGSTDEAKLQKTKSDLSTIREACKMYKIKEGRFPEQISDLVDEQESGHKYLDLEEVPTDPWGNNNEYRLEIENGRPVVICDGPDGQQDTEDDITTKNMHKIKIEELMKLSNDG